MSRREQTTERYVADLRRYAWALLGSAADADELEGWPAARQGAAGTSLKIDLSRRG